MEVFVKDFGTYRTIKKASTVQYSLVLDSLEAEASSVTLRGIQIDFQDVGNWLIADGVVYQIAAVVPENNHTRLTLRHPLDAFERPLELQTQPVSQTIGSFVEAQIFEHWVNGEDPMYAIPYLVVSNSDTTAFVAPTTDYGGCFALPAYCRLMRKSYRVSVTFSDAGSSLLCKIGKTPAATRNVSFEDGRSFLKAENYATSGYSKLTVLHDINTKEKDANGNAIYVRERTIWYLSEDGSISQLVPSRRAEGSWGTLHLKDSPNVLEKVTEAFTKNRSGHKLEFWSSLDIDVNTACTFAVHKKLLQSYISYKQKDSENNRYFYKAGELATTVTEKLKGAMK